MHSNKMSYKYCVVPLCKNTTISTPDKIFFNVPRTADIRKKWCQVIGRDETEGSSLSERTSLYCCEDHFNLEKDTDNYVEYRIMHHLEGKLVPLRLKKGAFPHIFQCTKTEDDIDIEEHDVLENPAIRSIFPDVTVLKEEMETYQEGLEQGLTNKATTSVDAIKFNYTIKLENTMDSLDDYDNDTNDIQSVQSESLSEVDNCKVSHGTETTEETFDKCSRLFKAFIQLDDLRPYLERSKRYCGECKILFPSTRTREVHNDIKHACLTDTEPNPKKENLKCNICNRCFTSTKGLTHHINKVHSNTFKTNRNTTIVKRAQNKTQDSIQPISDIKFSCVHCSKSFPSQESLIDHLYEVLQSKKNAEKNCLKRNSNKKIIDQVEIHRNEKIKHLSEFDNETKVTKTKEKIRSKSKDDYYFRCFICSSYFKSMLGFKNHLALNHQVSFTSVERKYKSKVAFDGRCKHCPLTMRNLITYNQHMKRAHNNSYNSTIIHNFNKKSTKKDFINKPELESEGSMQNLNEGGRKSMRSTSPFQSEKSLKIAQDVLFNNDLSNPNNCIPIKSAKNMTNNKLKRKISMNLIVPISEERTIDTKVMKKNETVNLMRKMKLAESQGEKSMEITLVLKKTLFKCTECDIHFLSVKAAMNHEHHAVEQLDSWKCETCLRVFKENDKLVHQKQHLFCNVDEFTVYELNSLELSRVLFACPKCDIHLTEDNFMSHYPVCGLDTLKSYYCKVCDISIDNATGISHETNHLNQNLKSYDFTIIKTEVILSRNSKDTTDVNHASSIQSPKTEKSKILKRTIKKFTMPLSEKKKNFKHLFKMFYCCTCKCYLTVANASKHNKHVVQKWICRRCGLVLPINSCAHSRLHLKYTNLKLQDFDFYEFRSKKRILPPIPEYFKCNVCDVNYISKATHECSEDNYLTCHVCEIKLSEEAFKLHLYFHNYFRANLKNENIKDSTSQMLQDKSLNLNSTTNSLTESENAASRVRMIIYCCRNCFVAVDSYDKVVEHCQEHYSPTGKPIKMKLCQDCDLKFDHRCYHSHRKLHFSKSDKVFFNILKFDTFYFTSENQIWVQHVLGSLPQKQKDEILIESIYRYECRIKMEVIQEGTLHLTMYKCYKCGCFIDYPSLHRHAEYSCFKLRKHPCSICGLPFISSFTRLEHEKIHQNKNDIISSKSYRIVIFNREEDKACNALYSRRYYVLYQCRNCDGTIDKSQVSSHECRRDLKKCITCGLLLYNDDYEQHVLRHKELVNFTHKNMKVMLFGKKIEKLANYKELTPSFNGIVCDFRLFSCKRCQVCVENIKSKHICSPTRTPCLICGLHFPASKLKNHRFVHNFDSDYIKENMLIITCDFERHEVISSSLVEKEFSVTGKQTVDDSQIIKEETSEDIVEEASSTSEKQSVEIFQSIEEEKSENVIEEASSVTPLQTLDDTNMIEQNTSKIFVDLASSYNDEQTANGLVMIEQDISENITEKASSLINEKTEIESEEIEQKTSKNVVEQASPATATDEQTADDAEMIEDKTSENVVEQASPATATNEQTADDAEMIEQKTSENVFEQASPATATDEQTADDAEMIEEKTSENVVEQASPATATDEQTADNAEMIEQKTSENAVEQASSATDDQTADVAEIVQQNSSENVVEASPSTDEQITDDDIIEQNTSENVIVEASSATDEQTAHDSEMIEQYTSKNLVGEVASATDEQTADDSEINEQNTFENFVKKTSPATDEQTADDSKMHQANTCKSLVENTLSAMDENSVGTSKKDKASVRNKKGRDPDITEKNVPNQNTYEASDCNAKGYITTLYKCTCGLHFLDEPSISIHFELCSPKIRTSRQTCSKCNLSFTPNILFSHFILHHGDKNNIVTYNIVDMAKKSKKTQIYYKCFKCNLYFVTEIKASEHFVKCNLDSRTQEIGTLCEVCHLTFEASSRIHEHTFDKNGGIHYQVISVNGGLPSRDISTERSTSGHKSVNTQQEVVGAINSKGSNLNESDKTIYKCKECGIHYLTKAMMRSHYQKTKHERRQDIPTLQDICTVCGLNFYAPSLTKHIANHHVKCDLRLNDLIIAEYCAEDF